MIPVLNEWVFHDLLRENGAQAFLETSAFLSSFCDSEHRLIVPYEPRWHDKANQLTLLRTLSDGGPASHFTFCFEMPTEQF